MLLRLAPVAASGGPAKCRCACLRLSEPRRISLHTSMPQSVAHFACDLVCPANGAFKHCLDALPASPDVCFPCARAGQGAVRRVEGLKKTGLMLQTAGKSPSLRHSPAGSRRDAAAGEPVAYRWQVVALTRTTKSEAVARVFGRGCRLILLAEPSFGPSARGEGETREPPAWMCVCVWICMHMHTFANCPSGKGSGV